MNLKNNMLIDEFKNHLTFERQLSPNTIDSYGRDIKQFADFCTRHNKGLAEASPELLDNFVDSLKTERTLAPASVFRKIEAVRCFYKFMLVEGLIKEDPTKFLYSPRLFKKYRANCRKKIWKNFCLSLLQILPSGVLCVLSVYFMPRV